MAFLDENGLARLWTQILARLNNFVLIEDGKGLSTNDYTDEDKNKLIRLEDRIAALESTHVTKTLSSVTLFADRWVGEASPYSQVVEISGTTIHSKVDLQPDLDQLVIFHEKDLTFVTENDDGVITVFCVGQKPTNDYTMQVTVTEVYLDE